MPALGTLSRTAETAGEPDHVLKMRWLLTLSPAWHALCLRSMVRLALRDDLPGLAGFYGCEAARAEAALSEAERKAVARMAAAGQKR